jgi:hypothetical protein
MTPIEATRSGHPVLSARPGRPSTAPQGAGGLSPLRSGRSRSGPGDRATQPMSVTRMAGVRHAARYSAQPQGPPTRKAERLFGRAEILRSWHWARDARSTASAACRKAGNRPYAARGHGFHDRAHADQGRRTVRTEQDGWTVVTVGGKLSAQFEHTVAVTHDGVRVLTLRPDEARPAAAMRAVGA